jgi:hypothetical protein
MTLPGSSARPSMSSSLSFSEVTGCFLTPALLSNAGGDDVDRGYYERPCTPTLAVPLKTAFNQVLRAGGEHVVVLLHEDRNQIFGAGSHDRSTRRKHSIIVGISTKKS